MIYPPDAKHDRLDTTLFSQSVRLPWQIMSGILSIFKVFRHR